MTVETGDTKNSEIQMVEHEASELLQWKEFKMEIYRRDNKLKKLKQYTFKSWKLYNNL